MLSREEIILEYLKRLSVIGILVVGIGWFGLWVWLDRIPGQPIQFPHSVHAKDRQISCVFCHTGAQKNDIAGVPSLDDCMQCHQVVSRDKPEIQKVVAAWTQRKDVQWTKIYNMPRHVHFSHRAHFNGGIKCVECHGDLTLQKTATRANFAGIGGGGAEGFNLHMGFCIDCHKKHEKQNPMLLDCSTCHY